MPQSALVIDDDRSQRRMVARLLESRLELVAREAEDGKRALNLLEEDEGGEIKLVLLDLNMPTMDGFEALQMITRERPGLPVIMLTGSTDAEDAVRAMKAGAVDFLCKPVAPERLEVSARNALKISLMSREISRLKRRTESALTFGDLIGHDSGIAALVKMGRKAASCDLPVLITGETGTGKEIFARAIHGESGRVGLPFIAVNCGAIPEKLVESTLFGHEKGAFTGAVARAPGKFQEANGGTIFLDEIGELPLEAQVKLLRVLQQKEVEPVGAARAVPVDVRVISATNRKLQQEVREGRFREDLYFRLNIIHIDMPPLRERKGDIEALARHFIERFCASHKAMPKTMNASSLARLQSYSWPGNVRELENVISRAMAMCEDEIVRPEDFSFMPPGSPQEFAGRTALSILDDHGVPKPLAEMEREIMVLALAHHGGNMAKTARSLGIAKSTLYARLEVYAKKRTG